MFVLSLPSLVYIILLYLFFVRYKNTDLYLIIHCMCHFFPLYFTHFQLWRFLYQSHIAVMKHTHWYSWWMMKILTNSIYFLIRVDFAVKMYEQEDFSECSYNFDKPGEPRSQWWKSLLVCSDYVLFDFFEGVLMVNK